MDLILTMKHYTVIWYKDDVNFATVAGDDIINPEPNLLQIEEGVSYDSFAEGADCPPSLYHLPGQ